jgi:ATP-dependent Lon protease
MMIDIDFHKKLDLHIHVPEGAIPKDGPSAGTAICTALVSILTRRPVRRDIAMTGELTLRGRVLPIGGLKEKILAAHRGGIRKIVIPKENKKDLRDIPAEIAKQLEIVAVEHMDEVLPTPWFTGRGNRCSRTAPSPSACSRRPMVPTWKTGSR